MLLGKFLIIYPFSHMFSVFVAHFYIVFLQYYIILLIYFLIIRRIAKRLQYKLKKKESPVRHSRPLCHTPHQKSLKDSNVGRSIRVSLVHEVFGSC